MDSFDWFKSFFIIVNEANPDISGIAQCIQCKAMIKFNRKSRTNCRDHAKIHKAEWKHFEEEKPHKETLTDNQRRLFPTSGQISITSGLLPKNHEENAKLRKVLAFSIGCSVAPVNIVQSPVVVNLVKLLAPRLSLPCNNTIQKDINIFAHEQSLKNNSILATALSYSLGVDGWSYNRRQCLAVTCFAFLENGSSKRLFIDLMEVEDQKAATVREACKIVCKCLNLDEKKLSAIVADNCSAMRSALSFFTLEGIYDSNPSMDDSDNNLEHEEPSVIIIDDDNDYIYEQDEELLETIPASNIGRVIYMYGCLAHKVQLVIRDGFRVRPIEELILKVKNAVRLIRRPRYSSLIKTIPLANDTRWSSCYHMLSQYLEHYDLIHDIVQSVCPGTQLHVITRSKIGLNTNDI